MNPHSEKRGKGGVITIPDGYAVSMNPHSEKRGKFVQDEGQVVPHILFQ